MKEQEKLELKNIFNELKKGNKKVIEELYKKYNKIIYGIAFSILKNKEDSEDVVQIVIERLYAMDKEKFPEDKEASWLYAVTKNETLLFLRKKNNSYDIEKVYNLEEENDEINKLLDKEFYNKLIDKLDSKEKEIVSLKVLSDLSFKQISKLIGEPIGTVKWRYYKSIYALKIMLSNFGMFIITFVIGVLTFKQTKKSAEVENKEDQKENQEDISGNFRNEIELDKTENIGADNIQLDNETQENITEVKPIVEDNVNYFGYGMISISCIFLIITIIFAIIFKKYQLKLRKKPSK